MNTADIVFPQRKESERPIQWMRRATQYCRLGAPDTHGDRVKVRPNRGHYNDAENGPVPCTIAYMTQCIQEHKADKLIRERFKKFCSEAVDEKGSAIVIDPVSGQVTHDDGSVDYYAPDAMGYPTLVMQKDANGEWL